MARFQGLNINSISLTAPERDWLIDILKQMNSISHTVMDDFGFTERCADAMPDTLWAHRSWNPFQIWDDTKTYLHVTPERWSQRVNEWRKHDNVYHHMLNEPSNDDVPKLVDWLIETMNLTGKNGKYPTKCIVGNLAVDKSFQHIGDSIRWRDDWLRLFRAFEQHKGWHMLGVHRYWLGDVRLAYTGGYPANIKNDHPNHSDYLDPAKHKLSLERLDNGQLPPHWTGYADLWMKQLCIEHGISLPDEMETEGIHDEKRDPGSKPFNEYVDNDYPTKYNDGRGRGTWTWKRWSEASSGLDYHIQLRNQMLARHTMHLQLEKQYPQLKGTQKGAHWFSFTKSKDWENGGFSLYTPPVNGDAERLQVLLHMADMPDFEASNSTPAPTPQPEPIQEPVKGVDYEMLLQTISTRGDGTTLRSKRDFLNEKTYTFAPPTTIEALVSDKPVWSGAGYLWHKVMLGHQVWWVAYINSSGQRTNATVTPVLDPTPEPLPDDDTQPLPEADKLAQLEARLDAQDRLIDTLTSQIAELLAEFEPVQIDFVHTTLEAPRILQKPIGLAFVDIAKELQAWGYRYAGIVTASQIADEIYSTTTPDMSLGGMLDEIMNGGDEDDSEDDSEDDLPLASGM